MTSLRLRIIEPDAWTTLDPPLVLVHTKGDRYSRGAMLEQFVPNDDADFDEGEQRRGYWGNILVTGQ